MVIGTTRTSIGRLPCCSQAEISNLHVVGTIRANAYENILRLEISVHYIEAVDVAQTFENLPE